MRKGIFDDDDWRMGRLDEGEAKEVEQALVSGRYGSIRRSGGAWPAARSSPRTGGDGGRTALQVRHLHVSLNTGGRHGRSRTGIVAPPGGAAAHQSYVLRLEEDETVRGEEILADERGPVETGNIGFDDREVVTFWDAVEAEERRGGRVQNRLVLEIPHELETAAVRALVHEFCADVFGDRGLPYHVVVHRPQVSAGADPRNVHAHVLYGERPAERVGPGVWEFAARKHPDPRRRDWVAQLRSTWCDRCNDALERAGVARRYDPRSYAEQGLPRLAGEHLGPAASALERAGIPTAAGVRNGIRDALWREVGEPAWMALQAASATLAVAEAAAAAAQVLGDGARARAAVPAMAAAIERRVAAEAEVADLMPAAAAATVENPRPRRRQAWAAEEAARLAGRRRSPRRLPAEEALARLQDITAEALVARQEERRAIARASGPVMAAMTAAVDDAEAARRDLATAIEAFLRAAAVDRLEAAADGERRAATAAAAARRRMPRDGLAGELAAATADARRGGDDADAEMSRAAAAERGRRLADQLAAADAWEAELRRRWAGEAEATAARAAALAAVLASPVEPAGSGPPLLTAAAAEAGTPDLIGAPRELPPLAALAQDVTTARQVVDDLLAAAPYGTAGVVAAVHEARARAAAEERRAWATLVRGDAEAARRATGAGLAPLLTDAGPTRSGGRVTEF